jgi:hypothetical protein
MTDLNDIRAQVAALRATQNSSARSGDTSRPQQPSSARNNGGRVQGPVPSGVRGRGCGQAGAPRSQREFAMHSSCVDRHHLILYKLNSENSSSDFQSINPDVGQRPRGDRFFYRNKMKATKDKHGAAIVRLYDTDIVVVRSDGAIKLSVGGSFFTQTTLLGMNDVLKSIGFRVKALNVTEGKSWSVIHPNGGLPFIDNMVIEAEEPSVDTFRVDAVLDAALNCGIACFQYVQASNSSQTYKTSLPTARQAPAATNQIAQANRQNGSSAPAPAAAPNPSQSSNSSQPHRPPPTLTRALLNSVQQTVGPLSTHPATLSSSATAAAPQLPSNTSTDNVDQPTDDLCVICFSEKKEHVAIPCGHVILCTTCSEDEKLMKDLKNQCPICRSKMDCVVFIG